MQKGPELSLECICEGLGFPEGPIWMKDGSIVFVEIREQRLSRLSPNGERMTIAEIPGGPNGAAIGPDGAVYICNNGGMEFVDLPGGISIPVSAAKDHRGGSIQRVDLKSGEVTTLYDQCEQRPLNSPNDIVFDRCGGFYFTDMGRAMERIHDIGAVYYALADGSAIELVRSGLHSPNGIGLSPDGSRLHIAETVTSRVWSHTLESPGKISDAGDIWHPGDVLGPLPGYRLLDSLAVDGEGNICVATLISGGITEFAIDGGIIHYDVPDRATTNICFGGSDMQDAWITASSTGRLYRTRWHRPGLELVYYA